MATLPRSGGSDSSPAPRRSVNTSENRGQSMLSLGPRSDGVEERAAGGSAKKSSPNEHPGDGARHESTTFRGPPTRLPLFSANAEPPTREIRSIGVLFLAADRGF